MANVIFKRGTKEQFSALGSKDINTLYWLKDVQELWMGDRLFGVGREATTELAGLLSPDDKAKLDALVTGTFDLVSADGSIFVMEIDGGGKSIGLNISAEQNNAVELKSDGIFVPVAAVPVVPEYVIERQAEAADGCAATYRLKRTEGEVSTYVGDPINIAQCSVLKSGTLEIVVIADQPYVGAQIGDYYLDLVLSDEGNTHIYVPVNGLVDTYTAGHGIEIVDHTVSVKIDAANANGLSVSSDGIGMNLATAKNAGAMSAVDKAFLQSIPSVYTRTKYEVVSKPSGTLVDYREKEIRVMCPADTKWTQQAVGANGDPTRYYIGVRAYAPNDSVVSFKEDIADTISDDTMYYFDGEFAGVDAFGRKYSVIWLPVAAYDADSDTWTYYGTKSSASKYIGWYYSVEWYDANGQKVDSDMIRIDLSNEACHSRIEPYYMSNMSNNIANIQASVTALEESVSWSDM